LMVRCIEGLLESGRARRWVVSSIWRIGKAGEVENAGTAGAWR